MDTTQDTTDTTTTDAKDTTMSTTDTAEAGTVTAERNNVVPFARKATEEPTDTITAKGSTADEPTEGAMMVDQRGYGGPSWLDSLRAQKRRDILPGYLTSWREARATAGWVARHYAHTTGYHAVRSPLYGLRLAVRSPRGAVLLVAATGRWMFDLEGSHVRMEAVRKADAETYLKLSRQRDQRVRTRAVIALGAVALGVPAVLLLPSLLPAWVGYTCLCVGVGLLGLLGSPADKPLVSRAVVAGQVQRLTSDIVIRALAALGLAEVNKAMAKGGGGITFPAPITRDGPGWRADVDLPYGVTVTDIMDRRDRLASGLRRPLGCVWPEPQHEEHAGRLVLWVGDQPMNKTRQPAWPLARGGQADVFKPLPFGTDQRGRLVSMLVMFANVLIGAMPRFGKTFALRALLLALALDPTVELRTFELKGTGDLETVGTVSHHYASGADDETIAACVESLREVYAELDRRAKVIRKLPKHLCPENKVTPQLSANRSLGLWPLAFAIDECQELFSHPEYGKEAGELATAIIKRGPAMGIMLILATQRPDKDSLPTGVSANVGIRFCLRVMGQVENDMVLGTSAYRNGIRATTFTQSDKGIGYLVGAADDPQIVRSFYLDGPAAEKIAARAYALRKAAGTLTGYAAGQEATPAAEGADRLLPDILAVTAADGDDKVWSETVVDRLADAYPAVYGPWAALESGTAKATHLAAALKPYGIKTEQVWGTDPASGKGTNRRGIVRADITDAVTERNRKTRTG